LKAVVRWLYLGDTGLFLGQFEGIFVLQRVPMGQNYVRMCLFPVINIIPALFRTQLRAASIRMAASWVWVFQNYAPLFRKSGILET